MHLWSDNAALPVMNIHLSPWEDITYRINHTTYVMQSIAFSKVTITPVPKVSKDLAKNCEFGQGLVGGGEEDIYQTPEIPEQGKSRFSMPHGVSF